MSFRSPARFYTVPAFESYVLNVFDFVDWRPTKLVLHNTSSPSLAQRPNGFTPQHMKNLRSYYEGLGWKSGPHLFVDDKGIWLFSDLDERGTHSPSWNRISWGIEQLGEYEMEAWLTGRGSQVAHNAVCAAAVLCMKARIDSSTISPHRDDPKTDHKSCPGRNCDLPQFRKRVHDRILVLRGS